MANASLPQQATIATTVAAPSADFLFPGAQCDAKIFARFEASTLGKKSDNRLDFFQQSMGEKLSPKCSKWMALGIAEPLLESGGAQVLADILPGLLQLPLLLAVRACGSTTMSALVQQAAKQCPGRLAIFPDTESHIRRMFAATDACFFFGSGDHSAELALGAMKYASLPVAPSGMLPADTLADFNPNKETGNAFLYPEGQHFPAFAAVVRAAETFRFPHDFQQLQRSVLAG